MLKTTKIYKLPPKSQKNTITKKAYLFKALEVLSIYACIYMCVQILNFLNVYCISLYVKNVNR